MKIIISGASGGMGKVIINDLINNNHFVYALDIHNDIDIDSPLLKYYQCDLNNIDNIKMVIGEIRKDTSEIDAIINLAGIFKMESIIEGSSEDLEKVIRTNFFGMYYLNRECFSLLHKGSKIINMSSELARYSPQPFMAYYVITKKMVDVYSDVLRRECNYLGIKVIKIQSGSMKTKMLDKANDEYDVMISATKYFEKPLRKMKKLMSDELVKTNSPKIISKCVLRILNKKNPKINYRIKNSFKLRLLNILPEKLQDKIYYKVIK